MPARSERLTIVPRASGQPCRARRLPVWWDHAAFVEAFRARELDLGNPVDWNLVWLLSGAEAVAWNEQCRAAFSPESGSRDQGLLEEMGRFEALLREAAWVIVESNEWESGLD